MCAYSDCRADIQQNLNEFEARKSFRTGSTCWYILNCDASLLAQMVAQAMRAVAVVP